MVFNDFEKKNLDASADLLRAITHPLRISLLNYIGKHEPVKVYEIHSDLNLDQSITSQHLRILRDSGTVITSREGKYIYYRINRTKLGQAIKVIQKFDEQTLEQRRKKR